MILSISSWGMFMSVGNSTLGKIFVCRAYIWISWVLRVEGLGVTRSPVRGSAPRNLKILPEFLIGVNFFQSISELSW